MIGYAATMPQTTELEHPVQFGPYVLQELINSGGMADLWLATNANKEVFALRRLHGKYRFNFLAKRRFFQGCEILSKIHNHEHVIGYVDHGKIDGTPYLVMEYVEGANLKQLLARADAVLGENLGNIIIDMALGLEHVHESGFMHLDFKPENVLVSRNAGVRVIDFDLAQPRPDKPKRLARNPGTPAYMAPEQLLHRPLDHRADIFAFGVTAYELLTLRKPFSGETPKEILMSQVDGTQDLIRPRELNPDIPAALEKVIVKCLERPPDKRYPYMSVVVRDLQSALYI
jgi:serine/threonine-protein kinase